MYLTLSSLIEFSLMSFYITEWALFGEINILDIIHSLFMRFYKPHIRLLNIAKLIGCTDKTAERQRCPVLFLKNYSQRSEMFVCWELATESVFSQHVHMTSCKNNCFNLKKKS